MGGSLAPGAPGWSETLTLADGTRLRLRELQPSDREKLRDAFDDLSPQSRYLRFLTAKGELTERELAYLTDLDGQRHFAIVAGRLADDDTETDGIGIARAIRLPDAADQPATAEIAVTVVDDMQGKGLGTALVTRLAQMAAHRNVERLRCELLSSNTRALEILRNLAPTAEREYDGPVTLVELDLRALGG